MFDRHTDIALTRIRDHNKDREPKLLARKYERMAQSAFAFFRGSCHLFYNDWQNLWPDVRPLAFVITGDLHVENFGVFKTLSRNLRYDINDFDEAIVASPLCDLARLLTSALVASRDLGLDASARQKLAGLCLKTYAEDLCAAARSCAERFLDEKNAEGSVRDLLQSVDKKSRQDLLAERTDGKGEERRFKRTSKQLDVAPDVREEIEAALQGFSRDISPRHSFRVIDLCFRVAGTGSLGISRYAALIEGRGGDSGQMILDIKEALPSSLAGFLPETSFPFLAAHDAERVVRSQRTLQGDSPAYLGVLSLGGRWFVVRELQPSKDRLSLRGDAKTPEALAERLETIVETTAHLTAWSHCRSAFAGSPASSLDLIRFAEASAKEDSWATPLFSLAHAYEGRVFLDHIAFQNALASDSMLP